MLRRILFFLFWNIYDSLGAWILLGVASVILSLPLVTLPAAWGGLLAAAGRAQRESEISLGLYWQDFKKLAGRSTRMGLLLLVVLALCVINIGFYTLATPVAAWPAALRLLLAGLFFWVAVFSALGLNVGWAFMTMQDLTLGKALKRGFMVLGAHPLAALSAFLLVVLLSVPLLLSVLGAVLLLGVVWANLFMAIAGGAIEHYEMLEDRRERERLDREGARSWIEVRTLDEREAARVRRHDRGWRDIFKPWQMR